MMVLRIDREPVHHVVQLGLSFPLSLKVLMSKTFLQVQKQIEQLQKEADELRRKEADGVLSRIKEAISVYGFTPSDLGFGKGRPAAGPTPKSRVVKTRKNSKAVAAPANSPKFRDEQGNVWSGRGPRPGWFKAALQAGKSSEELLAK